MTVRVTILNRPNLNLLGVREPHIYGSATLAAIEEDCLAFAKHTGIALSFHQYLVALQAAAHVLGALTDDFPPPRRALPA